MDGTENYSRDLELSRSRGAAMRELSIKGIEKLEAEGKKITRPSMAIFLVSLALVIGILETSDVAETIGEGASTPTVVGPIVIWVVGVIKDASLTFAIAWPFNHHMKRKYKEYIEFQKMMGEVQTIQATSVQQSISEVKTQKADILKQANAQQPKANATPQKTPTKLGANMQTAKIALTAQTAKIALTALKDPKAALIMFIVTIPDLVPLIEVLPSRALGTIYAYYRCNKAYKEVMAQLEEFKKAA